MKKLIDRFVNENEHGLMLLNLPVGCGKTAAAISHVAAQILSENEGGGKKYVITTPIKKNLPYKELLDTIGWEHRDKVLFLDSNIDSIIKHFDEELIRRNAVKQIVNDPAFKVLAAAMREYDDILKDMGEPPRNTKHNNGEVSDADMEDDEKSTRKGISPAAFRRAIHEKKRIEEEIGEKRNYESNFRAMVKRVMHESGLKTRKAQIDAIETDPRWKWIRTIFPASQFHKARVIFCSVHKMLYPIDSIVSENIDFRNPGFIRNFIFIMDEIDSCKDAMTNAIIRQNMQNIDIHEMYRAISSHLKKLVSAFS